MVTVAMRSDFRHACRGHGVLEIPENIFWDAQEMKAAQERWDRFYRREWSQRNEVENPHLRGDLALDKTLRALGRRPRPPLTSSERSERKLREEVEEYFRETSRVRNHGQDDPVNRAREAKLAQE